jgi:antitoxin component YwqK of YwqJK toxin-antitoxin module
MKFNQETIFACLVSLSLLAGCTKSNDGKTGSGGKSTDSGSEKVEKMADLYQGEDGLVWKAFAKNPFTGRADEFYPFQEANPPVKVTRNFKAGKLHGLVIYYFNDGSKRAEIRYMEGKKSGLATNWYKSGVVQWKRTFKDDVLDGDFMRYKPDGELSTHVIYTNGVVTKAIK